MRGVAFLLVAMALLASFFQADRQAHPQLLINMQQADAPAQPTIAPDPVARAKFVAVDAGMIDAVSYVNRFVNANISGMSDAEQYGRNDMWVMLPASGRGDCEDYALSKYAILTDAGYPPLLMRLVGVLVHKVDGSVEGHAILELLLPDGSHAFLDNMQRDVMTRPELEARGYQFVPWEKANG